MRSDDPSIAMCGFEILSDVLYNWDQCLSEGEMYKYAHTYLRSWKKHTGS